MKHNLPRKQLCVQSTMALFALGITAASSASADLPALSAAAIANGATITHRAGYEFVTIGNPGNAGVPADLQWGRYDPNRGSVPRPYAVARSEVTYAEYLPFLQGYASHFDYDPFLTTTVMGLGISFTGGDRHAPSNYVVRAGYENAGVEVGWRFAARYCNWLSNNRENTAEAFQTGAYDATTFLPVSGEGQVQDRVSRLPGAKFFMPTRSEWIKAMYYDGNRFGPEQGGYWQYPTTSNQRPIAGLPGTGAQTSAGLFFQGVFDPIPVLSYTDVMSPWGLFDGSGSSPEWLEEGEGDDFQTRYYRGSGQFGGDPFYDQIQLEPYDRHANTNSIIGIRLATEIPANGIAIYVFGVLITINRRKRCFN